MLEIKILGSGCANCHKLYDLAQQAVTQLGIPAEVELVTDLPTILHYGVMNTPGLVVNDKVISSGRVPAASQVKALIQGALN